jgi:type I restriction enzyme S subunit
MQNLFPTNSITNDELEITNVPNYRFPEFLEDGDWVETKLGEICEVITKGTTPQNFSDTGIRFIKIEAFRENQILAEKCMFITLDIHNKELKRSVLKENDILFAIAGATIGKVNIIKKEILPANTNQALAIVRLKEKENKKFILHILKSHIMLLYIQKSISVGAQPNLNLEQMSSFSFAYPENPNEQQKIASCLSSLDELITAQTEKIAQLKLHKKGLMQGFFP